ncbi:MAG: glycoside hydrolase family 99-like domain-containing protein [Lachnospiraceae bacterium]|nr:glycoside hydrolase family 99-like domain-containing protein [Lachnospiraceae bacterium]
MGDNKKSKVIAMYLPQYHEIPENNEFWGEGFTDWVSVKKAEPLYEGHIQPKEPLNDNYYDLANIEVLRWQAKIAKDAGIYGFCFYHYWFENDKPLLDKPVYNLLNDKSIELPFCFAWDNTSWVRSWSKFSGNAWAPKYDKKEVDDQGREFLLKLDYGGEKEWAAHFNYLLPFFKDPRYIKSNGKPVFLFFSTNGIEKLKQIEDCWRKLAVKNGFPGIYLISKRDPIIRKKLMDTEFVYQPILSGWQRTQVIKKYIKKYLKIDIKDKQPMVYDYDKVWKAVLRNAKQSSRKNILLGGFVNYDDTPRRGKNGRIIKNGSPKKFQYYFRKLMEISSASGKEFLFITAWNEWGEGAYLEPDKENKYAYLNAVKKVLLEGKSENDR